jgi:hypothetical protein
LKVAVVLVGINESRGTGCLKAIALPSPIQSRIIAIIADKRAGEAETME